MICAALEGGTARKVDVSKCLPARPSKTGRAITFGIQAKFSNLLGNLFFNLKLILTTIKKHVPVYKSVSAKGNLLKSKQREFVE